MRVGKMAAVGLALLGSGASLAAGGKQPRATHAMSAEHKVVQASELKWGPAPPGLPAGSKISVLDGDPTGKGEYTLRAEMPAGYKIMPHWHPTAEHITVLSGSMWVGDGDTFEESSAKQLMPEGFLSLPAHMHHYAFFKEPTVIQINGMGPFEITYINPKDDPRKQPRSMGRTPAGP